MSSRAAALLLLTFLLPLVSPVALAKDQLRGLLAQLSREQDPAERVGLVRRLAARDTSRAAAALVKLVRCDPHPDVRTEAALGLGRITADNALELMSRLLLEGGIRPVRRALAVGFARRDAGGKLVELLGALRQSALGRGLVIEALGALGDPASLHELLKLSASGDRHLRIAALRALSVRKDAKEMFLGALTTVLTKSRNTALLMAALDLVNGLSDPALILAVQRALTFPEPALRNAADHALRHLRFEEWKRAGVVAAAEGYAPPGTPRDPPGDRPRFDLVYALDGTGSVAGRLDTITRKIRERYRFLEELGSDVRVGMVVFRGHRYPEQAQVFPLSHDLTELGRFLDEIKTGGTDSQGAAVSRGLVDGLARMGWRWEARRAAFLVADSRCHDPARAQALAAIHLAADRTRVHVLYLLRTRRKIPDCIERLARIGGGVVEAIE